MQTDKALSIALMVTLAFGCMDRKSASSDGGGGTGEIIDAGSDLGRDALDDSPGLDVGRAPADGGSHDQISSATDGRSELSDAIGMTGGSAGAGGGSGTGGMGGLGWDAVPWLDGGIGTGGIGGDASWSPDSGTEARQSSDADESDAGRAIDAGIDSPVAGCPTGKTDCNGTCIDTSACCSATDCPGSCRTCDSTHACVALKAQDDPTGRCTGTCDSTGACKSKRGQACDAVAGRCVNGTTCSPENICCDTACNDSCQACDVPGHMGTCTTLSKGETPHSHHEACLSSSVSDDVPCAGKCDGEHSSCSYPTMGCGAGKCTNLNYQGPGTCDTGVCRKPAARTCDHICSDLAGCTGACSPGENQCSVSGVPQECSASGAWIDQAACSPGKACSGNGQCACSSGKDCGASGCVDTTSDKNNCGNCGYACSSPKPLCVDSACVQCTLHSQCTPMGYHACSPSHTCVCRQKSSTNLLVNPGFDGSLGSWTTTGPVSYDATVDADGCPDSGAVHLGASLGASLEQCVSVAPNTPLYFGFRYKGAMYCSFRFFSVNGCDSGYSVTGGTDVSDGTGTTVWLDVARPLTTTAETRSVAIHCSAVIGVGDLDQFYVNTTNGGF